MLYLQAMTTKKVTARRKTYPQLYVEGRMFLLFAQAEIPLALGGNAIYGQLGLVFHKSSTFNSLITKASVPNLFGFFKSSKQMNRSGTQIKNLLFGTYQTSKNIMKKHMFGSLLIFNDMLTKISISNITCCFSIGLDLSLNT